MTKLKSYLFSNISQAFFSIFGTLFLITSIVSLVRVATLTSIIKINFFELVLFYLYSLPTILFYTLPASLFISYIIAFSRLSSEYELIVITSLGFKPSRFFWLLFPITFIFSLMVLIISLGLVPKADHLNDLLLEKKKKEANFNIKASEFGQKFGDWLIYIDESKKLSYEGVKLFKDDKGTNNYQFIISKNAKAINNDGELDLTLTKGTSTSFSSEINQINFERMFITDTLGSFKTKEFTNSVDYWKDKIKSSERTFLIYILLSIFPLLTLPLVIAFGYYNPRYQKNNAVKYGIIIIVIYTSSIIHGSKIFGINTIYLIILSTLFLNYISYRLKIKKLY